jgi:pSer/pThr/pTyr-binding forkhead associated (FHA) protein
MTVHLGGRVIERKEFTGARRIAIGRAPGSDLVLDNTGVSRTHCEVVREGRVYTLCDLGSNNGTFVNGKRVTNHHLNDNDTIAIGKFSISFEEEPPWAPAPRAPSGAADAAAGGKDAPAGPGEGAGVGAPEAAANGRAAEAEEHFDATLSVDPKYLEARLREQERRVKGYLVDLDRKAEPIILDKIVFTIGKSPRSDIRLTGLFARARHAIIVRDEAGYHLCDASGRRRTTVNGTACDLELLHDGDEIKVGRRRFKFMVGSPLSAKTPAPREGTTRMRKPAAGRAG